MYTGTTNLMAAARETDRGVEGKPLTTKTLIGSMQISTYIGAGLGTVLFAFARPLLKAIIGNDAINPVVFAAALKYVRIRALGMPAAVIIGSTQAACLGMQDIRSPLYVLLAAAIVNFCGDMLFVGSGHPLIGGAAGAAWATIFSQYAALALFVRWLSNKPEEQSKSRVVNLSKAILEMTGKPKSEGKGLRDSLASLRLPRRVERKPSVKEEYSFSVRGFLKDKFSMKDLVKFPSKEMRENITPYFVPVTITQVGRVASYLAMSHVVASSLGTVSMAAQQVVVSFFYCLTPVANSLSLTAQSFVPAISEKKASLERAAALRKTSINFMKAGGFFGAAMVSSVCAVPLLSGFFTTDPVVVSLVNSVVPFLLGFFAVHGVTMSVEGLLLGQKDLSFLGKMYACYFFVVPSLMLRVKRAALTGSRVVDLTSLWKVFAGFQMFRVVAWLGRLALLQRSTDTKAAQLNDYSP
jgi:Na+-driven multidrug efflux pump